MDEPYITRSEEIAAHEAMLRSTPWPAGSQKRRNAGRMGLRLYSRA